MARRSKSLPRNRTKEETHGKTLRILFTCVGRRIELMDAFRRAAAKLGLELEVHGTDRTWLAPAMHHVDRGHLVPGLSDNGYMDALLTVVKHERIDLLFPTIDSELLMLSEAEPRFREVGCRAVISAPEVIRTCSDKLETYKALKAAGIDTPATWSYDAAARRKRHRFPYYMKPRFGSAGKGNYKIDDADDLRVLARRVVVPIVQEFVEGIEHTLDVYTGLDGVPRCAVPRRRMEVRSGEVSKGVVVKNRRIMATGKRVARALKGCRGVVTVQCILTSQGDIRVIEINPRLGGGAPLGIAAGADYPLWLMAQHLGRAVKIDPAGFDDGVVMLRYDQSVFLTRDAADVEQAT